MQPTEFIWKNGEFVKWADATVHVTAHALHYGSSVFEGVRTYATKSGPGVFRLQAHTRRLFNSAKLARMEMPFTEDQVNQAIIDTVKRNQLGACYIRPLAFRDAGLMGVEDEKIQQPSRFSPLNGASTLARRQLSRAWMSR